MALTPALDPPTWRNRIVIDGYGRAAAGSGTDMGTQANGRYPAARRFPEWQLRETRMLNLNVDHTRGAFVVETLPDRERVVVAPRGELDIATVTRVSDEIDALVAVGFGDLVLDLRGVSFMDVAGLRLAITQARRPDATVPLIDGPPAVARIFDLAGVRQELPFLYLSTSRAGGTNAALDHCARH